VKPSRRRPAVGTAENRFSSMIVAHPLKFGRNEIQRFIPGNVLEPIITRARPAFPPTVPDRGLRDPQRRVHHLRNRPDHRRWGWIGTERLATYDPPVFNERIKCAPVRQRWYSSARHGSCLASCRGDSSTQSPRAPKLRRAASLQRYCCAYRSRRDGRLRVSLPTKSLNLFGVAKGG
jgi:hypothetical protein